MNTTYSITSKGQVTLPKALRDTIGLTTTHRVIFLRRGNDIIIRKQPTLDEVSAKMRQKFQASGIKPASQHDYDSARTTFHEQGGSW
jgi:AbrB family looped-hinge helix DNA binding protein